MKNKEIRDPIICPGCGWLGTIEKLSKYGECPECGYEVGIEPYRLLTLSEMRQSQVPYNDVRLDSFLKTYDLFLSKNRRDS